jgi:hypothetical protein
MYDMCSNLHRRAVERMLRRVLAMYGNMMTHHYGGNEYSRTWRERHEYIRDLLYKIKCGESPIISDD